jgi:hypothetical protein
MSEIGIQQPERHIGYYLDWSIWRQWIAANAIGELIGLGGTALVGLLVFTQIEMKFGPFAPALMMVLAGTFLEGIVVGSAQWFVLHRTIKQVRWQTWTGATAVGAFTAWLLGMIPSTFMALGADQEAASSSPEIENWMMLALAAVMGLVLGPILALPQWWVLRRYMQRAGWWIPANALAWMGGMVIVFAAAGLAPEEGHMATTILLILVALLFAGVVVGAVHGLFLIWLLQRRKDSWT